MVRTVLLSSLFMFISCFGTKSSNQAPLTKPITCIEKDGLIELIAKNWKNKEGTNIYLAENDFLTTLQKDYQACISTLSKSDVIKLLGPPSDKKGDLLNYFINNNCNKLYPKQSCISLNFIIDTYTNQVLGIYELPYESNWH